MGTEVGSAQVPVFPTFQGFRAKVNTEVSGAGKEAGQKFTTSFKGAATMEVDTSRLTRAVGQAGASLAKARQQQATAAGKVRVAEAQLAEAIQKTGTNSARTVAAEEKLAAAQRGLATSTERTEAATKDLAQAQDRLKRSSEQAAVAGKAAASKYATGFAGVKQRIQGSLSSAFKAGGSAAGPAAKKAGSGLGGVLGGSMKAGIIGIIGSMTFGAVLDGFNDLVGGASDLNETVGKSKGVFEGQFKSVDKWAKSAATNLGLSRREALDAASDFGDMFRQIGFSGKAASEMSTDVVQLAADLGSFKNLPTADVADALSGAFRGEYDSLQRLIPNINAARVEKEALAETGKKNAKQLTAEEKAAATLAIVHKDGARAMGNYAATAGDLANRQKTQAAQAEDLSNRFGTMLIPIKQLALDGFGTLMTAGEGVTTWLEKNPAVMRGFQSGFELAGDAVTGFVNLVGPGLQAFAVLNVRTFGAIIRGAELLIGALGEIPLPQFQWARDAKYKLKDVADGADALANGLEAIGKEQPKPKIEVEDQASPSIGEIKARMAELHDKIVEAKAKGDTKEVDDLRTKMDKLKGKKIEVEAHVKKTGASEITIAARKGGRFVVRAFRSGGLIGGLGTGMSDSNLIAASRGEYMLKAKAVEKIGQRALDQINATGRLPLVPVGAGGSSAPVIIHGNVYGDTYLDQISKRDTARRYQQMQREGLL